MTRKWDYDEEKGWTQESYPDKVKRVWGGIFNRGLKELKTWQDKPLTGFEQTLLNTSNYAFKNSPLGIEDQSLEKLQKDTTGLAKRIGLPSITAEILGGGTAFLTGMVLPGLGEGQVINRAVTNINKLSKAESQIANAVEKGKKLSSRIDPDEMIRRQTLEPAGFKMDRKQLKAAFVELQDKGMSLEDAKKHLLGDGETFWIDNRTGEPISIQYNSKDPSNPHMVGWWSRGKRGGKRTLLTEQQSLGPGETAFTKYNATTNKVELLVKKGDEIHHWNSIIDKSSAYVGLSTQEAKKLTGLVREAGWMFGDNKANLIKMIRSDHKKIHAFMRENGIEGLTARKMMEKLYKGKSVEDRFKILRGFMEHVQGAVDEELVRMGYQIPKAHAAAQDANREVLKTIKMP